PRNNPALMKPLQDTDASPLGDPGQTGTPGVPSSKTRCAPTHSTATVALGQRTEFRPMSSRLPSPPRVGAPAPSRGYETQPLRGMQMQNLEPFLGNIGSDAVRLLVIEVLDLIRLGVRLRARARAR